MTMIKETVKEVSPATADKAQKLANLLLEAQEIANELVANDELKVLKLEVSELDYNLDCAIMKLRHMVLDYRQDIQDAMAHKF
jgi:hypothetical protein